MSDALSLAQAVLDAHAHARAVLGLPKPFFGAFTLQTSSKRLEYRVGDVRAVDERIVDWRWPLAAIFYSGAVGQDWEFEQASLRHLDGLVVDKERLVHGEEQLREIHVELPTGQHRFELGTAGLVPWQAAARSDSVRGLPEIRAMLTRQQYDLIVSGRNRPLIIQGKAGSGKTSVALHRLSWLTCSESDIGRPPVDPGKVLLVMFNKALQTWVKKSLSELQLEDVVVDTFHGWALDIIRRAYTGDIEIDVSSQPELEVAQRLKKHVGILSAMEEFVATQAAAADAWLSERMEPLQHIRDAWRRQWGQLSGPIATRFGELRRRVVEAKASAGLRERQELDYLHAVLEQGKKRVTVYKEDLHKLLGDQALLARHLTGVTASELEALATFQRRVGDVGRTERRPGPQVRFEDLALLLRLVELKHGGFPFKGAEQDVLLYDHLVVDETQDFGAVELAVLLSAVRSRTGVTIVGDLNQKIVPGADFVGWEALAEQLGLSGAEVTRLEVAHRSTQPIMDFADSLVGEQSQGGRIGRRPLFVQRDGRAELLLRAALELEALLAAHPGAHLCVVTAHNHQAGPLATELAELLGDGVPVRHSHNKNFEFAPGVTVTNLRQVKGLEFDAVFVWEPTEADYADDLDGRRRLYMLATRARDNLLFFGTGEPCAMLKGGIARGLVDS